MLGNGLAIEVENLSKGFPPPRLRKQGGLLASLFYLWRGVRPDEGRWAISDLSFTLERGKTLGLIGRNGAGKTTLLRLLAGVYEKSSGRIKIHGSLFSVLDLTAGIRGDLTGRENLETLAFLASPYPGEFKKRSRDLLEFSGLGARIDDSVATYSSGMLLRLAFSSILLHRPEVLLIDEVFSVGDRDFERRCKEKLAEYRRQGSSIVIASHDLDFMTSFCDECLLLEGGRIYSHASSGRVVSDYRSLLARNHRLEIDDELCFEEYPDACSPSVSIESRGRKGRVFQAGSPLEIRIPLDVFTATVPCILGIALKSADGKLLWGSNTLREGQQSLSLPSSSQMVLELSGGEFQPGEYSLDLCISDEKEFPLQYYDNVACFSIFECKEKGQEGVFRPSHRFRFEPLEKLRVERVE